MKRNRIVINLENLRARPREGGAGGCVKALAAAVVVLLIVIAAAGVGGYFWWRNYQASPAYTLALLTDAAQRNDGAAVDEILDYDKISTDFLAQVRQKASPELSKLWPTGVESALPVISDKLKETIHEQLIAEVRDLTDVAKGKPFVVVALAVPRFATITQDGQTAQATISLKNEQIKLTLHAAGDHWRIVAVQDDKLAKMVADAALSKVPTNVNQLQDGINSELDKLKKKKTK